MKRFILSLFFAICAIFAINTASAQVLSKKDMPEFVSEMKKLVPQEVSPGLLITDVRLLNSGSELIYDFDIDMKKMLPGYHITSDDMIGEFEKLTSAQKKAYFGDEFEQLASLVPVPIYLVFHFTDGKTYKMKLTD